MSFQLQQQQSTEGALFNYSVIYEHLKELGYPSKSIESMQRCGVLTGNSIVKGCYDCGDYKFIPLKWHCCLRTCTECAKTRSNKLKRKYMPIMDRFNVSRGKLKSLYFLTISPPNFSDYKEALKFITHTWKKFYRSKYIKERVDSGFWVVETKQSKEKGWNVHIHALFYGRRLDNCLRGKCLKCHQSFIKMDPQNKKYYCANRKCNSTDVIVKENSKIVEIWKKASRNTAMINIQELRSSKGGLNYVLKYVSANKNDFEDEKAFAEYIFYSKKQKLINAFGKFHNINKYFLWASLLEADKKEVCSRCLSEDCFLMFDQKVIEWMKINNKIPPKDIKFYLN